jgi:hypothetical protein
LRRNIHVITYNDVCVSGAHIHLFYRFPSYIFVKNKKRNIRGDIEDYLLDYIVANINVLNNIANNVTNFHFIKCL